jgi:site-specific DNA-methyltransferase (adenine-specific)
MNERRVVNPPSQGGASRFFYVAKASKAERNKGLEGFEEKEKPDNYIMPKLTCSECGSKRVDSSNSLVCGCNGKTHYEEQNSLESKNNLAGGNKNFHPTVKPIKLMQYLVKMITPPNGIVLDPFCGSGTTGVACKLDGFQFVGLEQDPDYAKIAEARINNYKPEVSIAKKSTEKPNLAQIPLF